MLASIVSTADRPDEPKPIEPVNQLLKTVEWWLEEVNYNFYKGPTLEGKVARNLESQLTSLEESHFDLGIRAVN